MGWHRCYNAYMNRRTLLLSSLGLSLAPEAWAQEPKTAKLALVIGCKNYLFSKPLGNTLNDARDMTTRSLGRFVVRGEAVCLRAWATRSVPREP